MFPTSSFSLKSIIMALFQIVFLKVKSRTISSPPELSFVPTSSVSSSLLVRSLRAAVAEVSDDISSIKYESASSPEIISTDDGSSIAYCSLPLVTSKTWKSS